MECFKSNTKNTKWLSKINYFKLLVILTFSFLIFTLFFYYIGSSNDLNRALLTGLAVSLLLSIGSIIGDLIEHRSRIFIMNKDELGYIEIHTEKMGSFLRDEDYNETVKINSIEDIFKDNSQYEGIDRGIIKSVKSLKKKNNRMIVKANVVSKEWKAAGFFTISKLYLVEKEYCKKIIIPRDYDGYEKLYKSLNKLK